MFVTSGVIQLVITVVGFVGMFSSVNQLFEIATVSRPLLVPVRFKNKKLSYRRETARQLHTSFSAHSLTVHFTEHQDDNRT